MPVAAIDDAFVLGEIVGQVDSIQPLAPGLYEVRVALGVETTGGEAGQLLNMLFGNSSIHEDLTLWDVEFLPDLVQRFPGPGRGLGGLREALGARDRALTCSALKPQGLPPAGLARLAGMMALGGIDVIKDDHGLADQSYSRFADRVPACAEAVASANTATGGNTRYWPSLSGDLDQLRRQVAIVRANGLDGVLVAPMILGLPSVAALVRDNPDLFFMAHPAMAGAARIAPPLLLGKLFRLLGADATVYPNYGGRFGYTAETCKALAQAALAPWDGIRACVPVPAGGMSVERVPELLDFYGHDIMLLIGGALLTARDRLSEATAAFVAAVADHGKA
jgi:ribulose-bisphosphate carboxylase large chain